MTDLTTAQKKALHHCHHCGHLLDNHHHAGGCITCRNDLDVGERCQVAPRWITTTYAEVAALLDTTLTPIREWHARWGDTPNYEETLDQLDLWEELGQLLVDMPQRLSSEDVAIEHVRPGGEAS